MDSIPLASAIFTWVALLRASNRSISFQLNHARRPHRYACSDGEDERRCLLRCNRCNSTSRDYARICLIPHKRGTCLFRGRAFRWRRLHSCGNGFFGSRAAAALAPASSVAVLAVGRAAAALAVISLAAVLTDGGAATALVIASTNFFGGWRSRGSYGIGFLRGRAHRSQNRRSSCTCFFGGCACRWQSRRRFGRCASCGCARRYPRPQSVFHIVNVLLACQRDMPTLCAPAHSNLARNTFMPSPGKICLV
jgi:hypothetical protein